MADDVIIKLVSKDEEPQILQEFLAGNSGGKTRQQEIHEMAEAEIEKMGYDENKLRQKVLELKIKGLKAAKTISGLSVFQDAFLAKAEDMVELESREKLREYRETGAKAAMPRVVSALQKAEQLVINEVSLGINDQEIRDLAVSLEETYRQREIEKDLHLAVNKGLDQDGALRFVPAMYELRKRGTAKPTNVGKMKENIIRAIKTGEELGLVHIKCLRFLYQGGTNLRLVTHLDKDVTVSKDGKPHKVPGEKTALQRLRDLKEIFAQNGIETELKILISDQDLDDYFPAGSEVVPTEDLAMARRQLYEYKAAILQEMGTGTQVELLRDYLDSEGKIGIYNEQRGKTFQTLRGRISGFKESFLEEKMKFQNKLSDEIYLKNPGREAVKQCVYSELASLQALGVLGKSLNGDPETILLVEDDRGNDNVFIGGIGKDALPVYFTKLLDLEEDDDTK